MALGLSSLAQLYDAVQGVGPFSVGLTSNAHDTWRCRHQRTTLLKSLNLNMSVSIFWDNSNIWLVGKKVCSQIEPGDENAFRIDFERLLDFALDGRPLDYAFVGGSVPPSTDSLWKRFTALGIKVETQERGQASGGEVGVDQIIQLSMANRILDSDTPGTMILLTGDGSGYSDGKGFIKQLELAHKHGWNVEVVSWDAGCNRYLRQFANDKGLYRSLEPVYMKVSFINNKRWVQPMTS